MSHLTTLINRAHARIQALQERVNQTEPDTSDRDRLTEDALFRQTIINLEEYQQLWTDWSQEEKREADYLIEKYRYVLTQADESKKQTVQAVADPEPRSLKIINAEIVIRIQLTEGKPEKMKRDLCLRDCFEELKTILYEGEDFHDPVQKDMAEKLYRKYVGVYFPEEGERLNPKPIVLKHAITRTGSGAWDTVTDDDIKELVKEVVELLWKHVQFEYVNCKLSKIQCSGDSLKTIIGVHQHLGYKYGLDLLIGLGKYIRQYPTVHLDWNQFTIDHIHKLKEIRAMHCGQGPSVQSTGLGTKTGAIINGHSQN